MWKPLGSKLCIIGLLCLALTSAAEIEENPADEIAGLVNANRTASKLRKLHKNPGLGCMALQLISHCIGNCSSNNTLSCRPNSAATVEIYAPDCGVELATVGFISGHLLGCHWSHLSPEQAFSGILVRDQRAVSLIHGGDLTELGAGFVAEKHGGFYWSVLFSNETGGSGFVLEEGGRGIEQKIGCFSGSEATCSGGKKLVVFGCFMKLLGFVLQFSFSSLVLII